MAGLALGGLVETARDRPLASYNSVAHADTGRQLRQICSVSTTVSVN
jgi:hypothetical protein